MSMNKRPKHDDEAEWFVTVIPLKNDRYYLGFRQEEGLEPFLDCQWYVENGLSTEKGLISMKFKSEHQAFWTCYQKSLEYVSTYGIQNVRSDIFAASELNPSILSHIDGLLKYKLVCNFYEVTCTRCLRLGHSADVCFSESNLNGEIIDESSESNSSSSSS